MWDNGRFAGTPARKTGTALAIYCLATLFAVGLFAVGLRVENIILVYLISVIVMMIELRAFVWGGLYTIVCIVTFNFLFTEPRFTLRVADPNYVIMMAIFLAVSAITGLLLSWLQEQVELSRQNEKRMKALLEISSGYLTLTGMDNIVYYCLKSLYQAAGERCRVYIAQGPGKLGAPYYIKAQFPDESVMDNDTPADWCFINNTVCGANTSFFGDSGWVYLPIRNRDACLGVIGVYTEGREIDGGHMVFINTVLSEMAMAVEKERMVPRCSGRTAEKTDAAGPYAAARSFLRDFGEPLRQAAESAERLLQSGEADSDGRRRALSGLALKLETLHNRAANHLQAGLLETDGLKVRREKTDFVELAAAAIGPYKLCCGERIVWMSPAAPMFVRADAELMKLAVANVLNNALVHTPPESQVSVNLTGDEGYCRLEIADRGCGIAPRALSGEDMDNPRGGLALCGEIVRANEGKMVVRSSRFGGTSIMISLKNETG